MNKAITEKQMLDNLALIHEAEPVMKKLSQDTKARLHADLVKLGDMMGDGLHHEVDGKWIEKEYQKTLKALGYWPKKKRANNSVEINRRMAGRVKEVKCQDCQGELKQTRSGSMKAQCVSCNAKFKLLVRK